VDTDVLTEGEFDFAIATRRADPVVPQHQSETVKSSPIPVNKSVTNIVDLIKPRATLKVDYKGFE